MRGQSTQGARGPLRGGYRLSDLGYDHDHDHDHEHEHEHEHEQGIRLRQAAFAKATAYQGLLRMSSRAAARQGREAGSVIQRSDDRDRRSEGSQQGSAGERGGSRDP